MVSHPESQNRSVAELRSSDPQASLNPLNKMSSSIQWHYRVHFTCPHYPTPYTRPAHTDLDLYCLKVQWWEFVHRAFSTGPSLPESFVLECSVLEIISVSSIFMWKKNAPVFESHHFSHSRVAARAFKSIIIIMFSIHFLIQP